MCRPSCLLELYNENTKEPNFFRSELCHQNPRSLGYHLLRHSVSLIQENPHSSCSLLLSLYLSVYLSISRLIHLKVTRAHAQPFIGENAPIINQTQAHIYLKKIYLFQPKIPVTFKLPVDLHTCVHIIHVKMATLDVHVRHGTHMEHAWNTQGTRREHAWNTHVTHMQQACNTHVTCMEHT